MNVLVAEHKTTSEDISPGGSYHRRLLIDSQIDTYLEGARALGYAPTGVLYDLLRKPAQRPSAKGETAESYGRRCLDAISEAPDRYYGRSIIVRIGQEENEAAHDRWNTAGTIRDARRLRVFPRNADACVSYGRECDFMPICCSEASADDPVRYKRIDRIHEELDSGDLELLTQSSLRTFRACPRRYFYRYEEKLRSLADVAKALKTGRSIHKGLEVWWKTSGDISASMAALDNDEPFDRAKEAAMLCGYHARWEEEQKKIKMLAVEQEFRFVLKNPATSGASRTFLMGGRIDAICEVSA